VVRLFLGEYTVDARGTVNCQVQLDDCQPPWHDLGTSMHITKELVFLELLVLG
jgi:hypothetical protein